MRRILIICVAAIASCTNLARADLVSVGVVAGPFQHPDGLHQTWRIIARFDNEFDQLFAIVGLPDYPYNPIEFTADSVLYNQALFEGLPFNDFPSAALGGELYDTYVTIGATDFPHNTVLTPNFLGKYYIIEPPPGDVIKGDHFGPVFDGAWFFLGAPPLVGQFDSIEGNDTIDVVVAQFTLTTGSSFKLTGNVEWLDTNNDMIATPFEVNIIPAPATLTMLIFSGLVATRKRKS